MRTIAKQISQASLLCLSILAFPSHAENNFTSTEGFQKTCQEQERAKFKLGTSNADKQSQVICRDIALVKQFAKWFDHLMLEPNKDLTSKDFDDMLRTELRHIRTELSVGRKTLEQLKLKDNDGLILEPAQWQIDLNGDGKINPWEKYFFAIVKPGERPFSLSMPNDDPAYYQQHFNLQARFRVDQSDVYWALAYHQFFEGFANFFLSFRVDPQARRDFRVQMIDAASLKNAHQLIGAGLQTSEKMRLALLAETDDELEWIPNPKQKNHVFPLAMDQDAFDIWGRLMHEFIPLWQGKTILVAPKNAGGLLGSSARLCPENSGLSVANLFQKAPTSLSKIDDIRYACTKIDAQHSASQFGALAQEMMDKAQNNRGSPEWHFVRYFYWVN